LLEQIEVFLHLDFFVILCVSVLICVSFGVGCPQDWLDWFSCHVSIGRIASEVVVDVDVVQLHHVLPLLAVVLFCVNWVGRLEHWLSVGVVFFVGRRVVSQQLENLSFVDFVLVFRVSLAVGVAVQVDAISLLELISVFGVTFVAFEHLFVWGLLFIEVKTLEVLDVLFVFGFGVGVNGFNASFEVRGRTSLISDALFFLNHLSVRTTVGFFKDW
jgi:hypothetical protein